MNWKGLIIATGIAGASAFGANAAVILGDTFNDGSTSVLNWAGDTVFASPSSYSGGIGTQSTDYVAPTNPYGITCFDSTSGCVDLDGSQPAGTANPAGFLESYTTLAAGTYTLTFDLSGNQRGGGSQITDVRVGGMQVWTSGSLASNAPWTAESVTFTMAGGKLDFVEFATGMRNDNLGNILDNVMLVSGTGGVPEPASWAMMIVGLAGLGGMLRRRGRRFAV